MPRHRRTHGSRDAQNGIHPGVATRRRIRAAHVATVADVYHHRDSYARDRHWREHGDLQRRALGAAPPASLFQPRPAGPALDRSPRTRTRAAGMVLAAGVSRLESAERDLLRYVGV